MNIANTNSVKYRADIDGLRAIAVLSVLFFHADIGFHGGYVGVDVFFVISGYLITGLILKDCDRGKFRILEFWERRVRRILPVLSVVILSSVAAGWFLFLPLDFKELGQSVIAQAMLMSNFYFWRDSGYFASAAEVKPLLHTWSLAVEEQFYLLFPVFLVALIRLSRKIIIPAIILLCSFSFSLCINYSYRHPSANFYLLPTRAWELLVGSLLAFLPSQRASKLWLTESLSWAGLLSILCAVFLYEHDTRFPGVAALLPCIGTALVIWANGHRLTSLGKVLATRPVVFIGLISYSLYLWHWPVLVFSKYWAIGQVSLTQRILLLAVSTVIAVFSWRFIEAPFRNRLVLKSRSLIFTFASLTSVVLLLVGLAIHKMQGVPSRIPTEALRYADGSTDRAFLHELGLKDVLQGDFIELGTGEKDRPIDLLVWGDSHAIAVLPVLDILCREYAFRGVGATHTSTAPLVGFESQGNYSLKEDSILFNDTVAEFIRSKHVGNVLLVANWRFHVNYGGIMPLRRSLIDTVRSLKESDTKIWIIKSVPQHNWNVPQALALTVYRGGDTEKLGLPLEEHLVKSRFEDRIFEGVSAPGMTLLDPTDLFVSPTGLCRVADGGQALYWDGGHLTTHGAMVLRPLFEPIFGRIGRHRASALLRSTSK